MAEPIATVGKLAGICAQYDEEWVKLQCDEDGYVTGQHQYDGSTWRKSNLLWGYHDKWDEDLGGTATGATWTAQTSAIPAGEVRVLQAVSGLNADRNPTYVIVWITRVSGASVYLLCKAAPGAAIPVLVTGNWLLGAGDVVKIKILGCVADDTILAGIIGYKMDITM